ncbi:MAG TPA: MFS transporter [Bacillota bacterium]
MSANQRITLITLIVCLMTALLPSAAFNVAVPIVQREWGIGYGAAGVIIAAYQVGYVVGAGILLSRERPDPRGVILVGSLLAAAGGMGLSLANSPATATALRALAGAGVGAIYMPGVRLLAAHFPPGRRGMPTGFYVSAFSTGSAASMGLSGLLLAGRSWQSVHLVVGSLALIGALALGLAWRRVAPPMLGAGAAAPSANQPPAFTPTSTHAATAPADARRPGAFATTHAPSVGPARGGRQWWLPVALITLSYTIHAWELYAIRSWLPVYLAEHFATFSWASERAAAAGATWSAWATLLGAAATAAGGVAADRFGAFPTAAFLLVASGVTTAAMGWLHGATGLAGLLLYAVLLVSNLTLNGDSPIYSAALTEWSPPAYLGRVMAVFTVVGYSAAGIASAAVGWGLDRWGWGPTLTLTALPNVLALAAVATLQRWSDQSAAQRRSPPAGATAAGS